MVGSKVVKMGWNPRVNLTHHGFGPGWVEIFLQISIRVDFLPDSRGFNPWWAGLAHQSANKRVTQVFFFIKLGFTFGSC